MSKPSVAVLMSTYNGERYLRVQIDSILKQAEVRVTLFIRDDGSKDNTVKIIKTYTEKENVRFWNDTGNLYSGLSFMKLLKKVVKTEPEFDYYAFADQDDIWLEEKLISAIRKIGDSESPVLYGSNQIIYQDGKKNGFRYKETPDLSFMGQIAISHISGCTMVMNSALAKTVVSLPCPNKQFLKVRCHDTWIYLIACITGKVNYDENSFILYRIHENNVVGIRKIDLKVRIDRVRNGTTKRLRSNTSKYLLEAFPQTDFKDRQYVEMIANYQNSLADKIRLIKNSQCCKTKMESKFFFAFKVMINYV